MKATDLPRLISLSRPSIHPNGVTAVVAAARPDLDADAYVGQLWSVALDGSAPPRRLTRGFRDSSPRHSPDGSLIAFLRATPDQAPQLHVVESGGGEPVPVTDRTLGVSEFAWAPDGASIAFVSREPGAGRYGTVEGMGAGAEPPRRITTQRYTENGVGYTIDRRAQVFLVETPDLTAEPVVQPAPTVAGPAEPRQVVPTPHRLTDDDIDYVAITFGPDGGSVVAAAAGHEGRDDDLRSGLYAVPIAGGAAELLTAAAPDLAVVAGPGCVAFDERGCLWFLGQEMGESGRDFVARNTGLYRRDADGAVTRLTEEECVDLAPCGVLPSPTGADVMMALQSRGRVTPVYVSGDGDGDIVEVRVGDIEVTGMDRAGDTVALTFAGPSSLGELGVLDAGELRTLTDFGAGIRDAGVLPATEVTIAARDGHPVHGWVVSPAGAGPHPVLLSIHGGPFAQYGVHLFDEAQVYADAGYAVVMCNPRGSAGYGQAHGRAIRQRMGTVDLTDVLDFLDGALAADPRLDGGRVGIMGGSYGGYLTAWTIAHDHRFAAAIVERGFLDPDGFIGTSDIGSFFGDEYTGTDPEQMRAQSPQAHAGDVRTPTLVLHSEDDLRCPVSQGERYYAALRRAGVPAELVIFPGENHELSRSGRPRHRLQRFEIILDWWRRHLPIG